MTSPEQRMAAILGFNLLGVAVAIGGGVIAYSRSSSWALTVFVAVMGLYVGNRFLSEVTMEPSKARRFVFFGLPPVFAVGGLIAAHELWSPWWAAMLVGFALGLVGWAISRAAFPDIWTVEERQQKSLIEFLGGGTPRAGARGGWPINR
jgi:hypothetical protein